MAMLKALPDDDEIEASQRNDGESGCIDGGDFLLELQERPNDHGEWHMYNMHTMDPGTVHACLPPSTASICALFFSPWHEGCVTACAWYHPQASGSRSGRRGIRTQPTR